MQYSFEILCAPEDCLREIASCGRNARVWNAAELRETMFKTDTGALVYFKLSELRNRRICMKRRHAISMTHERQKVQSDLDSRVPIGECADMDYAHLYLKGGLSGAFLGNPPGDGSR